MARALELILNELNEAEAELEAMAGYEEDYPEHYANVRARWDVLKQEYDQAEAEGDQNMSLPPESVCIGGGSEDELLYSSDPGDASPIAGDGDPLCLTDQDPEAASDQQAHEEWLKHVELSIVGPVKKFGTTWITAHRDTVPEATRARFGIRESDGRGGSGWTVSNRIADSFRRVVQRINDAGARLPSGGGFRPLYAPVGVGRSATSFHYSGLAVDLFPFSATLDPETDLLVVDEEENTEFRYRVYYRYRDGDTVPDAATAPVTTTTLRRVCVFNPAVEGKPLRRRRELTGTFLDLTQIFEEEGFRGISSQRAFRDNARWSKRLAMEWWHFEHTDHLSEGTLFGKVLLELHSYDEARFSPPWNYYDARYKNGKFGY